MTRPASGRTAGYAALVAAGSLWGLGFVFGKTALAHMPVGAMVTFRFAIASIAVTPLLIWRGIRIKRADMRYFALAALLFVPVQFLIQFEGLARTSVTHASLMVALVPVLVALVSSVFGAAARPKWAAVLASALGAALVVFGPGGGATITGDVLVALSLVAAVAWIAVTERRLQGYDPVAASAVVLIAGTAMLAAFELVAHPQALVAAYPASAWLATAATGLFSTTLATVFWNVGLSRIPSADAGVFVNLEPVVGSACGVAFYGDAVHWPLIAGASLVIGSAIAVTTSEMPWRARLRERTSGLVEMLPQA